MCLICEHLSKDLISIPEAWRNLHEMYDDLEEDHAEEVLNKLWEKVMSNPDEFDESSFKT